MKRNRHIPLIALTLLTAGVIGAAAYGVISIPLPVLIKTIAHKLGFTAGHSVDPMPMLWELRLPRIVMSLLVGASLALCGAVFQSIFRNPICDPYMLGLSSGASLGAAISFIAGWNLFLWGITLPALLTALLTLLLLLGVLQLSRRRSVDTLLLTGISLNFMISAAITLLIVYKQSEMKKIIFWTMGSLASISWSHIVFLLPVMAVCAGTLLLLAKNLTVMQLGDDTARSLGVNTRRTTVMALVFSSVLISVIVSFCGAISFIGLIVPHITRLLVGNYNRAVFFNSMLIGAFCLLLADTLARTVAAPSELPVGAVTAMTGVPYFIFLLMRNKKI
jgi:iron complex transport system permease protein